MALLVYGQPRVIQGVGSLSYARCPRQGIIVGFSHAVSLLKAFLWRSLTRIARACEAIGPRVVVDDASMQWLGDNV
eukprot:11192645-Lingulodinium_polyedra.AAC.1